MMVGQRGRRVDREALHKQLHGIFHLDPRGRRIHSRRRKEVELNRRFAIDPVTDARVLADSAEQVAHDVRRTVAAVEVIADGARVLYKVASPLVERLKSQQAFPPAKIQVLDSTTGRHTALAKAWRPAPSHESCATFQ